MLPILNTVPNRAVEVVERINKNKHIIHIINLLESNNNPAMAPYLPSLKGVELSISCSERPKKVNLVPGKKRIKFVYKNKKLNIYIDEIPVHSAIEILYKEKPKKLH